MEEKIRKLIDSDLADHKIVVDKIEYLKEGNNNFLRITIDTDGVIDIDTCVEATKIINPILDKNDIIKESYILDITSKERG